MANLDKIRYEYNKGHLDEKMLKKDPLNQLHTWLDDAIENDPLNANAMILSTVSKDCRLSSRIVLLKELTKDGLIFFTNYNSKKGKNIAENSSISVLFYWKELERQVRIEGEAFKTEKLISEKYFNSRPEESKISSIISPQSKEINNRLELEEKRYNLKRHKKELKRPENWGGYIIYPDYFEFWQGRENRLHDRLYYKKKDGNWYTGRLSP